MGRQYDWPHFFQVAWFNKGYYRKKNTKICFRLRIFLSCLFLRSNICLFHQIWRAPWRQTSRARVGNTSRGQAYSGPLCTQIDIALCALAKVAFLTFFSWGWTLRVSGRVRIAPRLNACHFDLYMQLLNITRNFQTHLWDYSKGRAFNRNREFKFIQKQTVLTYCERCEFWLKANTCLQSN